MKRSGSCCSEGAPWQPCSARDSGRLCGVENVRESIGQGSFREEIPLQRRVELAWRLLWGSMLACASAKLSPPDVHMADGEVLPLMKWTPNPGMLGSRELLRVRA